MRERTKTIVVTGDPVCDHHFYRGDRPTADSSKARGFRHETSPGGALLLHRLIATATASRQGWEAQVGTSVAFEKLPNAYHAFCLWEPRISNPGEEDPSKRFEIWKAVEPLLGYGHPDARAGSGSTHHGGVDDPRDAFGFRRPVHDPAIVVIDDAGLGFRHAEAEHRWPFADRQKPRWVVLKLSSSIGEGDLWKKLVADCAENLVVIVSADHLRTWNVRLGSGLSWEATASDVLAEIASNPLMKPLARHARHLVVAFGSDGALWMDCPPGADAGPTMLVFDAERGEGEWAVSQGGGPVFGHLSCITAAVVLELCRAIDTDDTGTVVPDFERGLRAGISATRELRRLGHGRVEIVDPTDGDKKRRIENAHPGFPFEELAACIEKPADALVSAPLPKTVPHRDAWMMLDEWHVHASGKRRPHYDAAKAVAILGPRALERFPVARFGELRTVDRHEIENLRSLRYMVSRYTEQQKQKQPLSIGVFGPPGAGKSFGIQQIAKAVLGKNVPFLTFNLSQFASVDDLIGAFHQVRDEVLKGTTPVVFWDEFDSQSYHWLQFLLAPMQDGAFQHGQLTHPIGKCIFVFAGATSSTYETFGPASDDEDRQRDFRLKKGPDFLTRLHGHLNVLGPNPRMVDDPDAGTGKQKIDETDVYFPLRRAFFIRSQFGLKHDDEKLDIDEGVLTALLEVPTFKAGSRSLEFLCKHLQQATSDVPRRSHLPGRPVLAMHVDGKAFWELCEQDHILGEGVEKLARCLHEDYRRRIKGKPAKAHLDRPFEALSEDKKAANRGQARRIPLNLRLAGMELVPGDAVTYEKLASRCDGSEAALREALAASDMLEMLAEAEHNGWMVERMLSGWRYGRQRDEERFLHEALVPYSQLAEDVKDFDRKTIIGDDTGDPATRQYGYVDIVKLAGFRVVQKKKP